MSASGSARARHPIRSWDSRRSGGPPGRAPRSAATRVRPPPRNSAGLALTRFARLLPALVSVEVDPGCPGLTRWIEDGTILEVSDEEVERAAARSGIEVTSVAEAPVPLAGAEHSRFVFFRESGGFLEHVAVLIGPRESWPDPVSVASPLGLPHRRPLRQPAL